MSKNVVSSLMLTIVLVLALVCVLVQVQPALTATLQETLASHWVPGWGFRDELNPIDIDYQNFWTDNAGKILSMAMTTGDTTDASYALTFLESMGLGSPSSSSSRYYLPEVRVNSSIVESQNNSAITNRIVQLEVENTSSNLQSLAIGNYYAGSTMMGYLGSDRILVSNNISRSSSSTVLLIPDGFSKRSLFETSSGDFYLYLNATLAMGKPYADVSIQVLPVTLNSSLSSNDHLYLQVFSSLGQFDDASLYEPDGSFLRQLENNSGSPSAQEGLIIPYSQQFSVFNEDSVAVGFNNSTATVNVLEHWYKDGAFDGLSWIGIGYNASANLVGVLSQPIYAKVYPLEHLDYHLVNDTASYIASDPVNVAVSPPVSFGFISYGLALEAASNPLNTTLRNLACGYWNYYYDRYNSDYSTAYSRSINLFAIAGFQLYGSNSTVESFTRDCIVENLGPSIEEYGWAAATLNQLYKCTNSSSDLAIYQNVIGNFSLDPDHFLNVHNASPPAWTFQYGEAASGLMLADVPFNSTAVLASMNAVCQSNANGTILNQPFQGDWSNTETLPAYMLSTWLFEGEMKNATGCWVSSLSNCNITSFSYSGDTLNVTANGLKGTLVFSNGKMNIPYVINGSKVISVRPPGDINGDGKVDSVDLALLQNAYNSHCANYHYEGEPASPNWNPYADMDNNGIVGLSDLVILALDYGQQYP